MNSSGLANDDTPRFNILANYSFSRHKYSKVFSHLRQVMTKNVMFEKMNSPERILIVENDEGEFVRRFMMESDTIQLYKTSGKLFVYVYFSHLSVVVTENIVSDKLARQVDMSKSGLDDLRKENAKAGEETEILQPQNQDLRMCDSK